MGTNYNLIDNAAQSRYEFHIGDHVAVIEYTVEGDLMHLLHTRIPKELEGQGIAAALTEAVLREVQKKGLRIDPQCSYAQTYIKRHPAWLEIVGTERNDG